MNHSRIDVADSQEINPVDLMIKAIAGAYKRETRQLRRDTVVLFGRTLDRLATALPGFTAISIAAFVDEHCREINTRLSVQDIAVVSIGTAKGNPSIRLTKRGKQ